MHTNINLRRPGHPPNGMSNIGHELTHVAQEQADPNFFLNYATDYLINLEYPGDAYSNIPAEVEARKTASRIGDDLFGRKGFNDVCSAVLQ